MKNKLAISLLILSGCILFISEKAHAVISHSLLKTPKKFQYSKNELKAKSSPGEILIKFKSNTSSSKSRFSTVNKQHNIKKIRNLFKTSHHGDIKEKHLSQWHKISLPPNTTFEQISDIYKNCPDVEFVEPNYIYDICTNPNDPYFNTSGSWGQSYQDMWGLHKANLSSAWEIEKGNASIIVAVVDTGIDYNHPDITNNIWHNPGEIPDNNIDDDQNGYIDDTIGWNFTNVSNDPKDGNGHGSHVAGTIAGTTNNGRGISGISWHSQVMAIKGITDDGWGTATDLALGIKYAADNGARVINLSWGGIGTCQIIKDALDYAHSKGCILVAAAGNSNQDVSNFFPANYEKAITVAATNYQDEKTFFSNYGTNIDVAAPGMDILSLKAEGTNPSGVVGTNYCRLSGTSMSAPHVCGVAALILSRHPTYTNEEVTTFITCSADDLGEEGKDIYFGWGQINTYKALLVSDGIFLTNKDLTVIDTPSDEGRKITVSWAKNSYSGIKGYKIYYGLNPFTNLSNATYLDSSPINNPEATSVTITNLGDESCGYYFSVIGNTEDGTIEANLTSFSTTEATYPVNNTIKTLADNDIIIAGFDPQTEAFIPRGTSNNEKTLDIFRPDTSNLPTPPDIEFSSLSSTEDEGREEDSPDELLSTVREIKTSSPLAGTIKLTIPYQINYSSSPLYAQEHNLRIYQLSNTKNLWEMVSGFQQVDKASKKVTCEIENPDWQNSTLYRIFPAIFYAQSLNQIQVYPNPYKPNSFTHHTKIIFNNLTREATIKIYNLAGEMVFKGREMDSDGKYQWQATNNDGNKLASGIYIYLITNNQGEKKTGKIGVIR